MSFQFLFAIQVWASEFDESSLRCRDISTLHYRALPYPEQGEHLYGRI